LAGDGSLIDSPGVRSFRIGSMDRDALQYGFREFRPYVGRCRFSNCRHDREPGCAIRNAVDQGLITTRRLANFQHLLAELEQARH
jgi:ribosome biogenesis GTPase / thiamine phosphate phosphatase